MTIISQNLNLLLESSEKESKLLGIQIRYRSRYFVLKKYGTLNRKKLFSALFEMGNYEGDVCNRLENGNLCDGVIQHNQSTAYHTGDYCNGSKEESYYCDKCGWEGDDFIPYCH